MNENQPVPGNPGGNPGGISGGNSGGTSIRDAIRGVLENTLRSEAEALLREGAPASPEAPAHQNHRETNRETNRENQQNNQHGPTLLIEESGFRFSIGHQLTEAQRVSSKGKLMLVKDVPSTILGEKNKNGRLYEEAMFAGIIREYDQSGTFPGRTLLCSADGHPENNNYVEPIRASHVVVGARIDSIDDRRVLFNDWLILDTDNGRNLRSLIESQISFGTSIRGLGELTDSGTVRDYLYLGTDAVGNPSAGTYTEVVHTKIEYVEKGLFSESRPSPKPNSRSSSGSSSGRNGRNGKHTPPNPNHPRRSGKVIPMNESPDYQNHEMEHGELPQGGAPVSVTLLQKQHEEMEAEISKLMRENREIRQDNTRLKEEAQSLKEEEQSSRETFSKEKAALEENLRQEQTLHTRTRNFHQQVKRDASSLADGATSQARKIARLEKANRELTRERDRLRREASTLAQGARDLQDEARSSDRDASTLASGAAELSSEKVRLERENARLRRDASALARGARRQKDELRTLATGAQEMQGDLRTLADGAARYRSDARTLARGARNLQSRSREREEELRGDLRTLADGAKEMRDDLHSFADGAQELKKDASSLAVGASEMKGDLRTFASETRKLMSDREELRERSSDDRLRSFAREAKELYTRDVEGISEATDLLENSYAGSVHLIDALRTELLRVRDERESFVPVDAHAEEVMRPREDQEGSSLEY